MAFPALSQISGLIPNTSAAHPNLNVLPSHIQVSFGIFLCLMLFLSSSVGELLGHFIPDKWLKNCAYFGGVFDDFDD